MPHFRNFHGAGFDYDGEPEATSRSETLPVDQLSFNFERIRTTC